MSVRAFLGARGCRLFFSSIPEGLFYNDDSKLREQLEKGLITLHRQGLITVWYDSKLSGGEFYAQETADHLAVADMIVLLLSPEFLALDFCYSQMLSAMQRYEKKTAQVIPVFLRPIVDWKGLPFGRLAPLLMGNMFYPFEANREAEWYYKIAEQLRSLVLLHRAPAVHAADPISPRPRAYRDAFLASPPVFSSPSLVQRTTHIEGIAQALRQEHLRALMLTGLGGSGKTVLAAQVYSFIEKQEPSEHGAFSARPLWFHIDETVTLLDIVSALRSILERPLPALDASALEGLTARERASELFSLIKSTPRLIVLDQFEAWLDPQTGQARPEQQVIDEWLDLLNTSSQPCAVRVLLVSRFYPHGSLPHCGYIQEYPISGLEDAESVQLLRREQLPTIEGASDKELTLLSQRCQGHVQTLAWLYALLKRDASLTISDLLHQPYYENWWIGFKTFEMLNTLYAHTLHQEQRALLMAFSVYRTAVPLEAALAITGSANGQNGRWSAGTLLVLLDLGLLQAPGKGLYRIHPVVANFMRAYYEKNDRQRWIEAHLRAASSYQKRLQSRFPAEKFAGLLDGVEAAWHFCQAGQAERAYRLIQETALFSTLHHLGHNALLLNLYLHLLAQKDWLPLSPLEASLYHEMGEIRSALGQIVEALQAYKHALGLFRQARQPERVVEALNNVGAMQRRLKHPGEAQACYQEALRICEESPTSIAQKGTTFNNLGRLAFEQGKQGGQEQAHYQNALLSYTQALDWYQVNGFSAEEAFIYNNLGEVYQALGEKGQAQTCYWRALHQFQKRGDRRGEGITLNNLGLLYQELAQQEANRALRKEARTRCRQALQIFRETGDRWQEMIVLRNLGRLFLLSPEFVVQERYRRCVACFLLARKLSVGEHNARLPAWIEETLRRDQTNLAALSYDAFLQEVEARAENIVEEILRDDAEAGLERPPV